MAPKINGSAPRAPLYGAPIAPPANDAVPAPPPKGTGAADSFDAAKGVDNVDGRLSGKAPYDQLPTDLKSKVSQQVWSALPEGQRSTLVASYQQFKRAGVWDEITAVTGEKEKREPKVNLPGGYQTSVAGNSGDIQYEIKDHAKFVEKLQKYDPNFGIDGGKMGAMHSGQLSIRQAGQDKSLHISVGPGNKMDAHLDQVTPVDTPKNGQTQMNFERGVKHWSTEVLPEMIRKFTGIPGVIVKPELKPGSRDGRPEGKITVNLELHGVSKQKPKLEKPVDEGSQNVPEQVMQNLALKGINIPKAPGGSDVDVQQVAAVVARKLQEAAEKGESRITLDLPELHDLKGLQKNAVGEVHRLTARVLEQMKAAGVDVSGITALTVTFGKDNAKDAMPKQGETVALQ